MLKIKLVILLCLFLLFTGVGYPASPENAMLIQAQGSGDSLNNAILDAKRMAVEKGIGTIVISQTEIENFKLKKDLILTKTIGSVREVELLEQTEKTDGTFEVRIKAVVSLSSIKSDLVALKILLESMDKPRMMVVVREKNGRMAENKIITFLRKKTFEVVDPTSIAAKLKESDKWIDEAAVGNPVAAAKLGALNGAEYLITGNVIKSIGINKIINQAGMKSGQATINATVINCSTGRVVASHSETSAAVHISDGVAMSKASEKAAEKLMDHHLFEKIITSFQDQINNGVQLDVVISKIKEYKTVKSIQQSIESFNNVVSVHKRSFHKGKLKLTVLFKGDADGFGHEIDGKLIFGKTLSVKEVSGSNVGVDLE